MLELVGDLGLLAVQAAASRSEPLPIVALCADLRGLSPSGGLEDPMDDDTRRAVSDVVRRHRGTIVLEEGHAIAALFDAPDAGVAAWLDLDGLARDGRGASGGAAAGADRPHEARMLMLKQAAWLADASGEHELLTTFRPGDEIGVSTERIGTEPPPMYRVTRSS